ncbi:MAG: LuxR C-terminal-related transcriptional regulator [Thermoanaerobaculia bacterium]
MAIRVVIADDHPVVLNDLARLFSAERDVDLVWRCTSAGDTLDAVRREQPDVLVLDARLDVLRALAEEKSATRVVLLSGRMSDVDAVAALRLGAAGIVLKENASRVLLQCVRSLAVGEPWLDPDAMHAPREPNGDVMKVLTRRELDIARMVAVGARNKKIAVELGIAEGTVKMHLHTIYEKLEISGRVELSIYAREHAIV